MTNGWIKRLSWVAVLALTVMSTAAMANEENIARFDPLDWHDDGVYMYALEEAFSQMGLVGNYPIVKRNIKVEAKLREGPKPTIPPIGITPVKTNSAEPIKPSAGAVPLGPIGGGALIGRDALVASLESARKKLR